MPKFYVYRTYAAYVTDITEVEAASKEEAQELHDNGEGNYIGSEIGDQISFLDNRTYEVLPAIPQNLPAFICVPQKTY